MDRTTWALGLALGVSVGGAHAADPPASALALQNAFRDAIRAAEPSVACVLVSRSDVYQRWFGQKIPADNPGRLGDFHPDWTHFNPPDSDRAQLREMQRAIYRKRRFQQVNEDTI